MRLWPYARANGEHTIDVLRRLRTEWPEDKLIVVWDGASYHRACVVREAAEALHIDLVPLPGYSPDFMPVEALWRWLREDVTYHHCHPTAEDLSRRVTAFETRLNQDPAPSPTDSGSRITSTLTKKNYASQSRRGLDTKILHETNGLSAPAAPFQTHPRLPGPNPS